MDGGKREYIMIEIIDRIIDEKIEVNRVEQRRESKRNEEKRNRKKRKITLQMHMRREIKIKKY